MVANISHIEVIYLLSSEYSKRQKRQPAGMLFYTSIWVNKTTTNIIFLEYNLQTI